MGHLESGLDIGMANRTIRGNDLSRIYWEGWWFSLGLEIELEDCKLLNSIKVRLIQLKLMI